MIHGHMIQTHARVLAGLADNLVDSIPWDAFSKLNQLTELNLRENRLVALDSAVFFPLRQLAHLYVHHEASPWALFAFAMTDERQRAETCPRTRGIPNASIQPRFWDSPIARSCMTCTRARSCSGTTYSRPLCWVVALCSWCRCWLLRPRLPCWPSSPAALGGANATRDRCPSAPASC